jgi:nitrogen fixation protein NifX
MYGGESMAFRVAVATNDGKFINQHFGRAQEFLIFDISEPDGNSYSFVERRQVTPPCVYQQHDDHQLAAAVALLADCRAVLVSRIGQTALTLLAAQGVTALEAPAFVDDALVKLGKSIHRFPVQKTNSLAH